MDCIFPRTIPAFLKAGEYEGPFIMNIRRIGRLGYLY